jgi:uncharacterized protein YbdZ (MbtH family)
MVVLIVLAALGYTLTSRVAAQRHRDHYVIDYTSACYARDSAIKYALTALQDLNDLRLISRPNEPDFSDLFAMSEPDYRLVLEQWAAEIEKKQLEMAYQARFRRDDDIWGFNKPREEREIEDIWGFDEPNDKNDINDRNSIEPNAGEANVPEPNAWGKNALEPNIVDPNLLTIPGPYGPPWPLVTEPVEFEIGSANVKIEIEDENAKFPAGWAVVDDKNIQREADASVETFCEWMGMTPQEIDSLKEQMEQVRLVRPFKVVFDPVTQRVPVQPAAAAGRRRGTRRPRVIYKTVTIPPTEQLIKQTRDFSRLFHSSVINTDILARPTIISEKRKESALKYMSLWGITQVNVNTAPRNVLESALVFGGEAQRIADEIIKKRRVKPFENFEDVTKELFSYSDKVEKCRPYLATTSSVFTIRITAASGAAKASAVIVVYKAEGKIEKVMVMCG